MTSQHLSELDIYTVYFNNDWNHLPPNGNEIPPHALGLTAMVNSKENNLTNKDVLNHTRHANATSHKPFLRETDANKSTLQDVLIGKIESEQHSNFRELKRKFDDLENKF